MPRAKTITVSTEQYKEILKRLDELSENVESLQRALLERRHLDEIIAKHEEMLMGNGKPGWYVIRDKVLSWDNKINGVIVAVSINIIWQVIEKVL